VSRIKLSHVTTKIKNSSVDKQWQLAVFCSNYIEIESFIVRRRSLSSVVEVYRCILTLKDMLLLAVVDTMLFTTWYIGLIYVFIMTLAVVGTLFISELK